MPKNQFLLASDHRPLRQPALSETPIVMNIPVFDSRRPFEPEELDSLVTRAETLLCYSRPDVERLAWGLARAIRQLRAEIVQVKAQQAAAALIRAALTTPLESP